MDYQFSDNMDYQSEPGPPINYNLQYYISMDGPTQNWLNNLDRIWASWKKSPAVTETLFTYFDTAPNPYESALRILANTSDFNNIKTSASLALTVVEDFQKWLLNHKEKHRQCLVPKLKEVAFKIVMKQRSFQLFKLVTQAYEFEADKEMFIPYLEKMIDENKFKDACQYASALHLETHFCDPEILILPLILQNKNSIAEEFLGNSRQVQHSLLTYLDNLLAPSVVMQEVLDRYIDKRNIPDVKMSTCQIRPMMKLLSRLVKKFDFSPDICPNHNRKRGEGALQFLVRKHFCDGSLSKECWREMAREAVGTDPLLHCEMINQIALHDPNEALYWANIFNVPKTKWPWSVTNINSDIKNTEENWDDDNNIQNNNINNTNDNIIYHSLKLPRESIILIDNQQTFIKFINQGLIDVTIVGIDAEWKPCFGVKKTELALIQIATNNYIYIIDVTTLGSHNSHLWKQLSLTLFENKNIIKLGFGLNHDISMIKDSLPALTDVKFNGQGFLDLHHLWRKLDKDWVFKFPYNGDTNFSSESLSKMVEICLGNRLNKTDQFSNWERRPLREGQIIYAALDAYCLLEVYNVLLNLCEKRNLPFYELCMELQHIPHPSPKKSIKKIDKKQTTTTTSSTVKLIKDDTKIPAHLWRVVCDYELDSLINYLRMCGVDCSSIKLDNITNKTAQDLINEGRLIITKKIYDKFIDFNNSYYQLKSNNITDQLKEILTHFNVKVCEENILCRCNICNQNSFQQVTSNIMWEFYQKFINDNKLQNSTAAATSSSLVNNWHDNKYYTADTSSSTTTCDYWKSSMPLINSRNKRTWFLSTDQQQLKMPITKYGKRIQFEIIKNNNIFQSVSQFYVCDNCGNIYWDGQQSESVINSVLENFIVKNKTGSDNFMCSNFSG
ncbi:hypothetical protein HCN44_001299 [Aphidius gifuensis]|uniref:3'-5' exonuclease domain-containing protein n=1 Tax=Aphidius gifuensis TaxID=684658 RepID=A0A834XPW8_APHGI|nr:exonuclease mut-7 homolog [Aphidius gifuensis]KAF7988726.1 hypothetical protein HCN44_001299 [Aphidius gifuensis]